jgi:hypothetical protein
MVLPFYMKSANSGVMNSPYNIYNQVIAPDTWRSRVSSHEKRISFWVQDRRERGAIGEKHPVYDFLFDYYSFRPSQLLRWSPGIGYMLCDADQNSFAGAHEFTLSEQGLFLDVMTFPKHRIKFLKWALQYLKNVQERPAQLGCFGLHEWAMLYKTNTPRHSSVPLRLDSSEINQVCESLNIRCSHYDAFRFFTQDAVPLNIKKLTRETTTEDDQPGCIHVTMDLYRYAYKIAPYSSAELIADAFALAVKAREVDMRASPYDLSSLGFAAIEIETTAGRASYVEMQKKLMEEAQGIRTKLIFEYQNLLQQRSHPDDISD